MQGGGGGGSGGSSSHRHSYAVTSLSHIKVHPEEHTETATGTGTGTGTGTETEKNECKRFLVLGTNCGFVSCLLEKSFIDDEPTFSLIKNEEILATLDKTYTADKKKRRRPQLIVLNTFYVPSTTYMMVSFSDGTASLWDLEKAGMLFEFDTLKTGIVLSCMQKYTKPLLLLLLLLLLLFQFSTFVLLLLLHHKS
jgi:hypothetical protein